jgi:thioesterase domain-containing protein
VRTQLPDAMCPADYVFLDRLPVSANGKLDLGALPEPRRAAAPARRAPGTPQEELLCGLVAEVLGVPGVGVDDDFFDLGGNSLLAARLVGAVGVALGVGMTVGSVFRAPTVARLAALIGVGDPDAAFDPLLPIRADGTGDPVFFVHPGIGLSWCYAGFGRHLPDVPLYGIQARALNGLPVADLAEMAADYLDQVRKIQPHGPYRLVGWSFGGNVAHEMAARLTTAGERVGLLALIDAYPYAGAPLQPGEVVADPAPVTSDDLAAVLAAHTTLARRHRPAIFPGDVLFFRADGHADAAPVRPDAWRPFVSGDIRVNDIPAGHHDLLTPRPLAMIARVLQTELEATR